MASVAGAQTLTLSGSALVVPQKFQKYYDSAQTVNLPSGFTASVYYTGALVSPRFMGFAPDGNLCVADDNLGTIFEILDSNGTGDTAIAIATNTENAHSLAFHRGSLFAASTNRIWRYDHPNASGIYSNPTLFIDSLGSTAEGSTNHTTRTLLFDDVTQALYISDGSACNACRENEDDTERGTILRFDTDGKHRSVYATGLRNAVGLALDSTHALWATVAERNDQGEDVPGDLVTAIDSNRFYGWPLAYGNHQWDDFSLDSEYEALLPLTHEDSVNVANMRVPDGTEPAHSTPLGILYTENTNLPAMYRHAFFVAIHGSYPGADGRFVANGSKIILLTNSSGVWTNEDFCTGFLTDSINYIRWARPAGIIMDRKGNVYFSDDNTSPHAPPAIFKISYNANDAVATAEHSLAVDVVQNGSTADIRVNNYSGSVPNVSLYDIMGRERKVVKQSAFTNEITLDLSPLEHGIYFVLIRTSDGTILRSLLR
ncbi:MAG TPA: T9SS type A sorting domain-containing protein [Candidatus Kapabacteria bacterium]